MRNLTLILLLTATGSCIASNTNYTSSTQQEAALTKSDHNFAQRALKKNHTFSDTKGRQLIAEIIEVQTDALKIRRQSDRRVMQLPVEMLCPKDKAFAAYLWEQKNRKQDEVINTEPQVVERSTTITGLDSIEGLNTIDGPAPSQADKVWANLF